MNEFKDFFFLGKPINTEIGELDFIRLKEYPDYISALNMMKMSKKEIIREHSKFNEDGSLDALIIELKKRSLFDIVHSLLPEFSEAYFKVLSRVVKDPESLQTIDKKIFNNIRKLILDMHCLTEDKIIDNAELQEFHDISKTLKQQDSQNDLKDIASCVAAFNGYTYEEISEMTMYQLYLSYYRMSEVMNYNTSTLFATVSPDVKVGDWSNHVDLYKEETYHLDSKEAKNIEKLFGD
ncbi:hypothetical protein [Bacillus atrophaeus]|uniref:hypothetical protein n=1 Tax=Bacillus atrophaeus TaxID=1452 RepID=UPI002280A736|nr:hypothetical protein [Bacillus atrophaeus]MCY8466873.1 hypothetical protein [Bacillus atrophaeus]MCY8475786.1 hypothetical protein [Bacillus atrophaeus]MCY8513838.1 hypothetical protein [Bacillus atrophaeus]MCY8990682.1 hypothetical protein [Bacillus atrophaeus]MED4816426.1 hypothetical protein [Bacillus atrophaeus]